jgi:S1-C subfamily serine protease
MKKKWLGTVLVTLGVLGVLWQLKPLQIPVTPRIQDEQVINPLADNPIPEVVESALPSVVTIQIMNQTNGFNPFNPFSTPGNEPLERNIASGFVVSTDGYIITNKHVVADMGASYNVITAEGNSYRVANIYRDPPKRLGSP